MHVQPCTEHIHVHTPPCAVHPHTCKGAHMHCTPSRCLHTHIGRCKHTHPGDIQPVRLMRVNLPQGMIRGEPTGAGARGGSPGTGSWMVATGSASSLWKPTSSLGNPASPPMEVAQEEPQPRGSDQHTLFHSHNSQDNREPSWAEPEPAAARPRAGAALG